jgi:hypothetical protein
MEKPRLSVSSENTSQKMFIGNCTVSEIVNHSDSDGGNVSELSEFDTCKVHPPFSSSSSSSGSHEEEVFNPEPDRDRKRTRRAPPKRADADFELGWKEKIQKVQKPAFGVPGINKKFNITQNSSPMDIFEIFFSSEVFKLMGLQNKGNRYSDFQQKKTA